MLKIFPILLIPYFKRVVTSNLYLGNFFWKTEPILLRADISNLKRWEVILGNKIKITALFYQGKRPFCGWFHAASLFNCYSFIVAVSFKIQILHILFLLLCIFRDTEVKDFDFPTVSFLSIYIHPFGKSLSRQPTESKYL